MLNRKQSLSVDFTDDDDVSDSALLLAGQSETEHIAGLKSWWDWVSLGIPFAILIIPMWRSVTELWGDPSVRIPLIAVPTVIAIAVIMGCWRTQAELPKVRQTLAWILLFVAVAFALIANLNASPFWCFGALAIAIVAWGSGRLRGEPLTRLIAVGIVAMIPAWLSTSIWGQVQPFVARVTAFTTSGLLDFMVVPHLRSLSTIRCGLHSIAIDQPKLEILSVAGLVALTACILIASRRSLFVSMLTILTALLWWSSTQAMQWAMVCQNMTDDQPPQLSGTAEILYFLLCIAGVVSANWFWAGLFEPIPMESLTSDFPAISQLYSALVAFPDIGRYLVRSHSEPLPSAEDEWDEDEIAIFKRGVASKEKGVNTNRTRGEARRTPPDDGPSPFEKDSI